MHLLQNRLGKYEFIDLYRHEFPVEMMCKVLAVSRNTYYTWKRHGVSKRVGNKKESLKEGIRKVFEGSRGIYGSYRIAVVLNRQGNKVSRSYVARLMQQMGLRSMISKKFISTTDSRHDNPVAENLLDRKFFTSQIGLAWVSDITYVRLKDQWAYLTVMIDLADRAIVGWSLSDDMTAENTVVKA